MKSKKLVSIIIPTYKRPDRLDRAIESCLAQSYKEIEVLVVDDNNEGDEYRIQTEDLMEKYSGNERVRYYKHTANQNGSAARNTGIINSRGNYITFLDDDDYIEPQKIERQAEMLYSLSREYGVVCCGVKIVDEITGKEVKKVIPGVNGCTQFDFLRLRFGMSTGSNPMFTREAIEKTGLFDVTFIRHQDTEYMIRVLRRFKLFVIPECLVIKYEFGNPNRPNAKKYIDVQNHFFETFKEDISSYSPEQQKEIYRNNWNQMCIVALEAGDRKLAYDCYRKAKEYKRYSVRMKLGLLKKMII